MRYPSPTKMIGALNTYGLRNQDIADKLGVSDAAVSCWKTGANGIRLKHLKPLRDLYTSTRKAHDEALQRLSERRGAPEVDRAAVVLDRLSMLPEERLRKLEQVLDLLEQ